MKRSLRFLYHRCMQLIFMRLFSHITAQSKDKHIYLVDIDNTLSDTWPSLKDVIYHAENERYQSLSIFIGMRKFLLDIQQQHQVIFISARDYLAYNTTRRWLKDCGIKNCSLILVPGAMEKLSFLLALVKRRISVVYIDDLSYNHEHGEVKRYDLMLSMLNMLPITYIGLNEIEEINANHENYHHHLKKIIETAADSPVH